MGRGRSRTKTAPKAVRSPAPPVAPAESAFSLEPERAEEPEPEREEEPEPDRAEEPETERADLLRELVARGGPRGPGSGGKGRSRREREELTNWPVPAGHERKISSKIRASLAKRRRRQQRTGRAKRSKAPAASKAKKKSSAGENLAL